MTLNLSNGKQLIIKLGKENWVTFFAFFLNFWGFERFWKFGPCCCYALLVQASSRITKFRNSKHNLSSEFSSESIQNLSLFGISACSSSFIRRQTPIVSDVSLLVRNWVNLVRYSVRLSVSLERFEYRWILFTAQSEVQRLVLSKHRILISVRRKHSITYLISFIAVWQCLWRMSLLRSL